MTCVFKVFPDIGHLDPLSNDKEGGKHLSKQPIATIQIMVDLKSFLFFL